MPFDLHTHVEALVLIFKINELILKCLHGVLYTNKYCSLSTDKKINLHGQSMKQLTTLAPFHRGGNMSNSHEGQDEQILSHATSTGWRKDINIPKHLTCSDVLKNTSNC